MPALLAPGRTPKVSFALFGPACARTRLAWLLIRPFSPLSSLPAGDKIQEYWSTARDGAGNALDAARDAWNTYSQDALSALGNAGQGAADFFQEVGRATCAVFLPHAAQPGPAFHLHRGGVWLACLCCACGSVCPCGWAADSMVHAPLSAPSKAQQHPLHAHWPPSRCAAPRCLARRSATGLPTVASSWARKLLTPPGRHGTLSHPSSVASCW